MTRIEAHKILDMLTEQHLEILGTLGDNYYGQALDIGWNEYQAAKKDEEMRYEKLQQAVYVVDYLTWTPEDEEEAALRKELKDWLTAHYGVDLTGY